MASVFDVSPYDGGGRLKIADTGEVLVFSARRRAIAQGQTLVRAWPLEVGVKVRPPRPPPVESWTPKALDFPYPLGAPS